MGSTHAHPTLGYSLEKESPARAAISTISIACAADARYALPLAVMLNSLGSQAAPGAVIDAYVLDDGIPATDKLKVAASLPANIRLHWRQPCVSLSGLPMWGRMSLTTYRKLTLGLWLPVELTRVIWLDCDLLVLQDPAQLWRADMQAFVALAIQDQRVPLVSSPLGVAAWRELRLPPQSKYFNAGVLVIDLDRWRQQGVYSRCLEYLAAYRNKVYFWDQEALNAVLAGRWGELDPRWNWHPSLDHLVGSKPVGQAASAYGAGRAETACSTRWIVHFSGNLKPWNFPRRGPWQTLYQEHLDRTAWAGRRPVARRRDTILSWYEASRLRRFLYPTERWTTMAVRALTREFPE
jgi:lipopolysaccharide biosynthesis glycosyltransferase